MLFFDSISLNEILPDIYLLQLENANGFSKTRQHRLNQHKLLCSKCIFKPNTIACAALVDAGQFLVMQLQLVLANS